MSKLRNTEDEDSQAVQHARHAPLPNVSSMMIEKPSYGVSTPHGYTMIDPKYVHMGSLGPKVDAMIGTSPLGAPMGFVLKKLEYEFTPPTCSEFIVTYRDTERHIGMVVSKIGSPTTYQYDEINGDSATSSSAEFAAQAPQRLEDGDLIVANILTVTDGRSNNEKSGNYTIGVVPCVHEDPTNTTSSTVHYGTFSASPSSTIVGNSIGGSARIPCSTVQRSVAVVHVAEDAAFYRALDRDTTTGTYKEDAATPIMAVVVEGFTASDAAQFRARLTTYALTGPRNTDHSHPGPNFETNMKCLTKLIQRSPIYFK